MSLNPVCPECGFESDEVRCPRCNALKVMGCQGSCWSCGNSPSCQKRIPAAPEVPKAKQQGQTEPTELGSV